VAYYFISVARSFYGAESVRDGLSWFLRRRRHSALTQAFKAVPSPAPRPYAFTLRYDSRWLTPPVSPPPRPFPSRFRYPIAVDSPDTVKTIHSAIRWNKLDEVDTLVNCPVGVKEGGEMNPLQNAA